ncbi:MAG: tRNA lysidine(34) synthetase TilS [Ignavibacteriaceae bacterium]|nr:tRNA lysidine(34) synthetase TilS [Ignavibacteriaceae bacterium]
MKRVEEKVINFIRKKRLLAEGDKVLVAFSGGPDSVFLLKFLIKFKKKYKIEIAAAHLNHCLRGKNSDADERFCINFCNTNKITCFTKRTDVRKFAKDNKLSIEEAGRNLRYNYFDELVTQNNFTKIATGHHLNDNSETFLMNLIRGAGLKGLTGIPAKRRNIIRPILAVSKNEIFEYLKFYKIDSVSDKSNDSEIYSRNFIRKKIVGQIERKMNPNWSESLFNTSQLLNNYESLIEKKIKLPFRKKIVRNTSSALYFDRTELLRNFEYNFLLSDIIRSELKIKFDIELKQQDVFKLLELAVSEKIGRIVKLNNSISAYFEKSEIIVRNTKKNNFEEVELSIDKKSDFNDNSILISTVQNFTLISDKQNPNIEYIDCYINNPKFVVRYWKNGDYFYPLGMEQKKKISDFLVERKVRASEKRNVPVLLINDEIVWVVGHRISNRFKVNKNSKNILRLEVI